jgi:hypothetical protein
MFKNLSSLKAYQMAYCLALDIYEQSNGFQKRSDTLLPIKLEGFPALFVQTLTKRIATGYTKSILS